MRDDSEKITVVMKSANIAAIDRAGVRVRELLHARVTRSALLDALVESADLEKIVAKLTAVVT